MSQRVLEPEAMDGPEEAAAYDAMDHSGPNRAFCLRLLELGAGGRMLDLGTGPGHIPLLLLEMMDARDMLAQRGDAARQAAPRTIVGLDLAPAMLEIARRKAAGSPYRGQVQWVVGDAKRLDFPSQSFDAVFSNTILHHIPDPVPFLREAWRVLRPGGTLLIRDLFRPADEAAVAALVHQHAADADAAQRKLFADSLRAALTPEELRAAAKEAGMIDVEVVVDTDRHMSLQRRSVR